MIRFVYPNIDEDDCFAGCGRFLTTRGYYPEVEKGYELADPNIGNLSQIMTAASMLAPESFDSDRNVYEYRDDPDSLYLGDSLGLAYLLSLIKRSRLTVWDKRGISADIWCTGVIDIVDNRPFLKNVFHNLFDIKLKAFLNSEDSLFILPVANLKPGHNELFEENHVAVISLSQFSECPVDEILKTKTVLKVHGHEITLLTDTLFKKPSFFSHKRDSNVSCKFSYSEIKDRHNLMILMNKVRQFWIEGVLKNSLYNAVMIELGKKTQPEAVEYPWESVLKITGQKSQILPSGKKISEVFDDAGRTLLILGKPGSGKTVTLLELAHELIIRAENDPVQPVPVIFNLSSWSQEKTIFNWLVSEMSSKYLIPEKMSYVWIEEQRIVPLLDGLDEVNEKSRAACVRAINEFVRKTGLSGLAVCSRRREYSELSVHLKLSKAICLRSLNSKQIKDYLARLDKDLSALHILLNKDRNLQIMAKSPLLLNIMILTYCDLPAEDLNGEISSKLEECLNHLFDTYIGRMFNRKSITSCHKDKIIGWLSWLARNMKQHNQSVFMLEQIQPSWLATNKQRWFYYVLVMLIAGLPVGLFVGLSGKFAVAIPYTDVIVSFSHGITFRPNTSSTPLIFGACIALASCLTVCLSVGRVFRFVSTLIVGFVFGLAFRISFGVADYPADISLFAGLTVGSISGLAFALIGKKFKAGKNSNWAYVVPVETLRWSWKKALSGLAGGLLVGFAFGIICEWSIFLKSPKFNLGIAFGVAMGLTGGLFGGLLEGEIETKIRPNQGIWQSFRNAVYIGSASALCVGLPVGFVVGLTWKNLYQGWVDTNIIWGAGISAGLTIGVAFGIFVGLFFGGIPFIQHFILRFILCFKEDIPRNLVRFLDHAVRLIFLQKVGGGYIFIHRLLLEHFAAVKVKKEDRHPEF